MPTRILHVSDLHVGARDDDILERALTGLAGRISPALVIASGDLTHRGRRDQHERAASILRALGVPVLAVPGNHDIPYSVPARFTSPWAEFERHMEKYWSTHAAGQWERSGRRFALWKTDGMDILGVRFATPLVDGYARPLVVTPESPEIEIPASGPYLRLHFLGHVTAPGGHPVEGAVGDTAASYTVRYTAGRTVEVPLRNGIEIAAGNIIDGATRIDPVATLCLEA